MNPPEQKIFRLIASCPDRVGIVAGVTTYFAERGVSIRQANQYEDHESGMFFMRYVVDASAAGGAIADFTEGFQPIAKHFNMTWRLVDAAKKQRIVIFVSKFDHCLAYLMHRWKVGDLPCEICGIVSNHETLRELVEWYNIPYHYVPVPGDAQGKQAAFEKTAQIVRQANPDSIVLARYMQIFPPWLCEEFRHRVINIHHSFLPSFAGAKPYHQAKERGVKVIGATCHYVTEELDAGPIIDQDVIRIRHNDSIEDMMRYGKDVENVVLARGLRYHLEDRILVQGNKTILFDR
jgi:formyltetrahydrofolate deformylase